MEGLTTGGEHLLKSMEIIMPWVAIRTGIVGADGKESVLREYLCDWPDCAHVAEHVVGVARDVNMTRAVCPEHAAGMQRRAPNSSAD
jgi:hypothetical protein